MRDVYEAVIGDDIEACWWSGGTNPDVTAKAAVLGFVSELWEDGDDGDYTVTIYRNPTSEDRDGEAHIYAWDDRGTCTASITDRTTWTVGRIMWEGLGVVPVPMSTPKPPPLVQAVAEARDLAGRLAVSKGIAGTKGESALLDVRDALAAALRGVSDV